MKDLKLSFNVIMVHRSVFNIICYTYLLDTSISILVILCKWQVKTMLLLNAWPPIFMGCDFMWGLYSQKHLISTILMQWEGSCMQMSEIRYFNWMLGIFSRLWGRNGWQVRHQHGLSERREHNAWQKTAPRWITLVFGGAHTRVAWRPEDRRNRIGFQMFSCCFASPIFFIGGTIGGLKISKNYRHIFSFQRPKFY